MKIYKLHVVLTLLTTVSTCNCPTLVDLQVSLSLPNCQNIFHNDTQIKFEYVSSLGHQVKSNEILLLNCPIHLHFNM